MIQANCRAQFTADDFSFVVRVLAKSQRDAVSLVSLLSDEAERDAILDHDMIYDSVVDSSGCLQVSAAFYFYILTRRVLRRASLDERALTEYVAAVLAFTGFPAAQWWALASGLLVVAGAGLILIGRRRRRTA